MSTDNQRYTFTPPRAALLLRRQQRRRGLGSGTNLTAAAHPSVASIHDRMLVIVPESMYGLDKEADVLDDLLSYVEGDGGELVAKTG